MKNVIIASQEKDCKNDTWSCIKRVFSNTDKCWYIKILKFDRILNECLKNVFHNVVPNRIIKCNYRHPPWMTDDVKNKLKERAKLTKKYATWSLI